MSLNPLWTGRCLLVLSQLFKPQIITTPIIVLLTKILPCTQMLHICDHSIPMGWRNRTKDFALLFKSFILGLVSPTNIRHYHAKNKVAVDLLGCFDAVFRRRYRCFSIALKDCHKIFTSDWLWIEVCQNAVSSKVDITMTAINKKLRNQQHAFRPFPFLRSWELTCFLTTCKCILNFHFKRFSVYL